MSRHVETAPADPDVPGAFRFAEPGKLADILTAAGAIDVRERIFKFDIAAPISPEEFWEMRSGTSETLRAKLATMSEEERSRIATEVEREGAFAQSLIIDVVLLGLFAVQHSVLARPGFKKAWTKIVPKVVERSTYVLLASLLLALLFWQWQPLLEVIWEVRNATIALILQIVFFGGWALVLISTFLISHFDLFGLRQVFLYDKYSYVGFRTPFLYKFLRHPTCSVSLLLSGLRQK
jgi:protein-S-isoprenylcysteine O-methyltransferase Ste14